MTKDKYKYVEGLLRNYKKNKSRIKILELGMINEQDRIINGIDYSRERIQTSNLGSLDNSIIAREEEMHDLLYKISITEALIDSLDSRKDSQYRQVVENYYIENKTCTEVMAIIGMYNRYNYFELCKRILNELVELVK